MGFIKYTNEEFSALDDGQINILALFGNGVDMQLMEYLSSPYRTSYENFYKYLCYKNFDDKNIIFRKMKQDKKENEYNHNMKNNWSDFENSLIEIFNEDKEIDDKKLAIDFDRFQKEFSNFLNEIVTPEMLARLGSDSTERNLAVNSFTRFLGDLSEEDYKKLNFPSEVDHYKLFNWEILNFNYTSLLDNILTLDKIQFDPEPRKTVDRQINYYVNPNNYKNNYCKFNSSTIFSCYLMTNIRHPHGYQNVPKSMLFGFDNKNQITNNKELAKYYLKPYWAQNDKKYKSYFKETDLFIIYGMSLGNSDYWWWSNILGALLTTSSELIIYKYYQNEINETKERVIDDFINLAMSDDIVIDRDKLHSKIAIVQYTREKNLDAFKLSDRKSIKEYIYGK
ncbi:MAG: AbiH family protein [Gemella sp.]|nr:AbiH family protein [Gemella sp.]